MRPCYYCKRFHPAAETTMRSIGEDSPDYIGGCEGKGIQHDPDITEKDLGMYCDLFSPVEGVAA